VSEKKKEEAEARLWAPITLLVLVVVGIVLAILAGRRSITHAEQPAPSDNYFFDLVKSFGPWLLVLFIIYFFVFRHIRFQKPGDVMLYNDAFYLVTMNRLDEAEAKLLDVQPRWKKDANLTCMLRAQLANIEFERGNFKRACDVYEELLSADVIKNDGLKQTHWTHAGVLAQLAAQAGDIALAERMVESGRDCDMLESQGPLVRAEVILLARKRDYAEAVRVAQMNWRLADTAWIVTQRNRYRVAWAFALQQLDAEQNAEQIANLVAGVKPFWKGQFNPLTNNWPEMEAFLVQHKLTDEYAAA
jgi:hypothetical protein